MFDFYNVEAIYDQEGRLVPNEDGFWESQEHYDDTQDLLEHLRDLD